MSNKTILLVVVVFFVLVVGMFVFAYLKKAELSPEAQPTTQVPAESEGRYNISRIDAKHFYSNGVHTLVGEIPLPTPCDLLTTTAEVAESMPELVTFDFGVVNNSENCAQVVTAGRFNVSATSSKNSLLKARFMGEPVELNVIEAAPGETPEEFELYTKG